MDLHSLLSGRLEGLRRNGDGTFQARCPICALSGGDTGKQHLRIWPSQAFRCVKDDSKEHNKAIRAVIYDSADPETLAELSLQVIDPEPKLEVEKVYGEDMLARLTPDYRYWVNRGITEEVLRRMEGGLAPADERSKLSSRYIFPVRDEKRRIVGWTGRLVSDASFGPKWKHICKASRVVYPICVTGDTIRTTRKVVLLESIGDGLQLASGADMWNWLVLLGLNLNARILGYLVSINPRAIIISTNNDAIGKPESANAGNKAADKLRTKLVPFFGEERVVIRLPQTGKDWGESSVDEIRAFKAEVDAL